MLTNDTKLYGMRYYIGDGLPTQTKNFTTTLNSVVSVVHYKHKPGPARTTYIAQLAQTFSERDFLLTMSDASNHIKYTNFKAQLLRQGWAEFIAEGYVVCVSSDFKTCIDRFKRLYPN